MTDIRQEFRRSSRFGIVGVVVVMVLCAAIALVFGSNSAHPTGALIAIFVIVFGFVGVMLHLQRRDVDGAEAHAKFEATSPTEPVTDPTLATQTSLLADLAVKPIDGAALAAASGGVWGWARSNLRNEWVLIVLIACAVIPWQLWQSKWSLIIFVPLILLFVGYLAIRLLMPGGTLQQAYDSALPTLDALGFSEAERPELKIRRQPLGPQPFKHGMEGASVYSGNRHGRDVSVTIEGTRSIVSVGGAVESFEVKTRGETLRAGSGAPPAVEAAIEPLRASSYWKGVSARGGTGGVTVQRKGGVENWMRDLWLAEHLADAARRG